jgi:ribosome-binding factor A
MSRRMESVNGLLRQEISRVLASELKDPRLSEIVSITRVDTSKDLRHAKVFVSVLGKPSEKQNTLKALRSAAGFIHRSIRQNLTFKATPSLRFYPDESIERGAEILELMNQLSPDSETPERASS